MTKRALAAERPPDRADAPPPSVGEVTRPQRLMGTVGVSGSFVGLPGFGRPAAGTITTYRMMRANPTIAIARMAATAPPRAAKWSFEADEDAPDGAKDFIAAMLQPMLRFSVSESLRALDYGYQAFELVWEVVGGKIVLGKMKPLLPELTKVVLDKDTGRFAGVENQGVELGPTKALWFSYDREGANYYGRSRNENVRKVWSAWNDTLTRVGQYTRKAAGVTPMVRYPVGRSLDAGGAEQDNFDIATRILQHLGRGEGVAWPTSLHAFAEDLMRQGVDIDKLYAWQIVLMEAKGRHGAEFERLMKLLDTYLIRGWLVPERAIAEGRFGTKAEASAHAAIGIVAAEEVLLDIADCINWYVVDRVLLFNYGPEAVGRVRAVPEPLQDAQRAFFRELLSKVLTQPATVDLLFELVDIEAMIEQGGLPVRVRPEGEPPALPELPDDTGPMTTALAAIYAGIRGVT